MGSAKLNKSDQDGMESASSSQPFWKKGSLFWGVYIGVVLVFLVGVFYLPCWVHHHKSLSDKIDEMQQTICSEKNYIKALHERSLLIDDQERKTEIGWEIEDRNTKVKTLEQQCDVLRKAADFTGRHVLLPRHGASAPTDASADASAAVLSQARECMERAQDSSDQVDDLSSRFITFILTAGTLFIASLGVWSWRKAAEFEKENDKIREQSERVSADLKGVHLQLCDVRYVSASLTGDMLSEKNLKRKAQSKYKDALAILDAGLKEHCNQDFLHEKTIVLNKLGDIQVEYGDFKQARKHYQESQDAAMRLVEIDGRKMRYQRDLLFSYRKLGDVAMKRGDMNRARKSFEQAIEQIKNLPKTLHGEDHALMLHDQNAVLRKLGEVAKERGDLGKALQYIENAMEVANDLLDKDSDHVKWRRDRMLSLVEKAKILQDMGSVNSALEACQNALQSADESLPEDSESVERLFDRSTLLGVQTSIEMKRGDLSSAEKYCSERLRLVNYLVKLDRHNTLWRKEQSAALKAEGDVLLRCGQYDAAKKNYRKALDIAKNLVELDGSNWQWQSDLRVMLNIFGNLFQAHEEYEESEKQYSHAFTIAENLVRLDKNNWLRLRDLSVSSDNWGNALRLCKKYQEAEKKCRYALDISEKLAQKDAFNALWQSDLKFSLENLGNLLKARNEGEDWKEAESCYRRALEIAEELVAKDGRNAQWQRDLRMSLNNLGNLLQQRNEGEDWKEAESYHRRALEIAEELVAKDGSNAQWRRDLFGSLNNVGNLLQQRNEGKDWEEAERCHRRALKIMEELVAKDGSNAQWQRNLWMTLNNFGNFLRERNEGEDRKEAEGNYRRALAIADELVKKDDGNAQRQRDLRMSLRALGFLLQKRDEEGDAEEAGVLLSRAKAISDLQDAS